MIPSLSTNSSSGEMNIRLAALTTIGYLCEELTPEDLSIELKNLILQALTTNISNDASDFEPTKLSVKALTHAISYAKSNFEN